ncbi:hypothetical protein [Streptomyces sp. NPDC048669]|uniref:hypothetical protein n=1 Tax=Streptomyces sp. NPDC048669 TaxID=3155267 RepID=UPI0034170E59
MNLTALALFRAGHLPLTGEALALPLVEAAGSTGPGDPVFQEIFHPVAEHVDVLSCDWYVLRRTTFDYQHSEGHWSREQRETYDRGDGATILLSTERPGTGRQIPVPGRIPTGRPRQPRPPLSRSKAAKAVSWRHCVAAFGLAAR